MVLAVINLDGTQRCVFGSEDDDHYAFIAPLVTLENEIASTILDRHPVPYFSDCAYWALITLGSVTYCIPAAVPPWSEGVSNVLWDMIPAHHNIDMSECSVPGEDVIYITEPGTEILIE